MIDNAIPLLAVHDLDVAAGGEQLISGLSFTLQRGERLGLSGPSGCGKTTLLRCLVHLIDPAGGTVELHGQRPDQLTTPVLRRRMVLLAQKPVVLDETVEANLRLPFEFHGAGAFPAERAGQLQSRLGLGGVDDGVLARALSVGQQQRLCLIRALLIEPAVILLDEPTSALDEANVDAVEALLAEQCEREGVAAIMVTHNRPQLDRWCSRQIDLSPFLVNRPAGPGEER
jgi:putative ABC transport system ATP-binding protein